MAVDDELLDLPGLPKGLVASRVRDYRRRENGELYEVRHRRGLRKLSRVELMPAGHLVDIALDPAEEQWLLQATTRRWSTISSRYRNAAMSHAVELTRAGVVRLVCPVDEGLRIGEPTSWVLTEEWAARAKAAGAQRDVDRRAWRELALTAAATVELAWPPLAEALTRAAGTPLSAVTEALVYAARDLAGGVTHDGPRAFSMAHYGKSKARDDIAQLLTDAGAPPEALVALGVRRSSRLGLAGPVQLIVEAQELPLGALDGPVLVRADQSGLRIRLTRAVPVIIVENLQAAECLADQARDTAVVYTAGPPSDASLRLIADLAAVADRVVLVPDADLGGVRISERVLAAAPLAELVDIGMYEHPKRAGWPRDGATVAALKSARSGRAGALAEACLRRGYPVEQELATVRAVKAHLGTVGAEAP